MIFGAAAGPRCLSPKGEFGVPHVLKIKPPKAPLHEGDCTRRQPLGCSKNGHQLGNKIRPGHVHETLRFMRFRAIAAFPARYESGQQLGNGLVSLTRLTRLASLIAVSSTAESFANFLGAAFET